ncbi:diguanylate cyclase/phosphodiesterase (GGDEF & EAL domains) with PAS/PAC sensor(s) [hydrothermal vent metagenome]|uniref:Diguanylate cyclase/phosphodiesterase (GGDEF & EAL domains) with PAS/PAC sensor(S) n=1 Tax=hydrothermal vent metagenome TaxID=652676 RepID=A0A3B0YVB5_9ZZZZ
MITDKINEQGNGKGGHTFTTREVVDLIHELKVKHYQLESQNDRLRETQKALRISHEKFMELYDFAPIGYISVRENGEIAQANLTAAILLGEERESLPGTALSEFVADDDKGIYSQFTKLIRNTISIEKCELKFMRGSETVFYAQLESGPIRYQELQGQEYRMLLSDISERKRIEEALLKEKERVQITLESIGDAVITTDENGFIDYLNPIAETLTEWSRDAAIGKHLEEIFKVFDDQTHQARTIPIEKCLKLKQVVTCTQDCLLRAPSGRDYGIQYTASPIRGYDNKVMGIVLVFSNISEVRTLTKQIAYQATHDSLTGLVNRREFEKRLARALKRTQEKGTVHALCYLDLDHFKIVNDTAGHLAGDELLKKLSHMLSSKIRSRDTLARFGGDEFSLLLDNCPLDKALQIANSIVAAVSNIGFEWDGSKFDIGVSVGIVEVTDKVLNPAELMSRADVACYSAKNQGRNRAHVYNSDSATSDTDHFELHRVAELSGAIKDNRFKLFAQRIKALDPELESQEMNYELLLRSVNKKGEIELPGDFIPAAERYSMMDVIDRWVIQAALRSYQETFAGGVPVTIGINLSGNSMTDVGLQQFIRDEFNATGVDPQRVCFEITEMTAITNLAQAREFILGLKKIGCRFALDDFGSGLSSFTYLKNLPVDFLKIDGSFVQDMVNDKIDHAMVAAINQVGHIMGIKTIAECVENEEIIDTLREIGVDYIQGFSIERPIPLTELVARKAKQV